MRKINALALFLSLFAFLNTNAQYKDLEGVFFGKVIALGAGAAVHGFADKDIGTTISVTAINYSVLLKSKLILSSRLAFHKKFTVTFESDGFSSLYTQTAEFKLIEYEASIKIGLTPEGIDKPTSVFLSLQAGILFGKQKTIDSRYGEIDSDPPTTPLYGGGLTLYQRLGSRFILYAEPSYRFVRLPEPARTYLGDYQEKEVKFNHYSVQFGILFLIGKSRE